LEIDECIEWILHTVAFKKHFNFRYAFAENWEFLIFGAKDYYIDTKALKKIEKTTGMILVQIKSCEGMAELWFGRMVAVRKRNLANRIV
jgi:hypothetical protein